MSDRSIGHLVTAELIAALKELYPLRPPLLSMSDREVWRDAGQQQLIEFLEAAHNDAIHNTLIMEQ